MPIAETKRTPQPGEPLKITSPKVLEFLKNSVGAEPLKGMYFKVGVESSPVLPNGKGYSAGDSLTTITSFDFDAYDQINDLFGSKYSWLGVVIYQTFSAGAYERGEAFNAGFLKAQLGNVDARSNDSLRIEERILSLSREYEKNPLEALNGLLLYYCEVNREAVENGDINKSKQLSGEQFEDFFEQLERRWHKGDPKPGDLEREAGQQAKADMLCTKLTEAVKGLENQMGNGTKLRYGWPLGRVEKYREAKLYGKSEDSGITVQMIKEEESGEVAAVILSADNTDYSVLFHLGTKLDPCRAVRVLGYVNTTVVVAGKFADFPDEVTYEGLGVGDSVLNTAEQLLSLVQGETNWTKRGKRKKA